MNILIIDDSAAKSEMIRECLQSLPISMDGASIDISQNLSDAAHAINTKRYDLIVLDLMLPYIDEGEASSRAGLEMLKQIRRDGSLNINSQIVGLSAFPDELSEARGVFERNGVLIISFSDDGLWKDTLSRIASKALVDSSSALRSDFVILTALEEEREGFLQSTLVGQDRSAVSGLNVWPVSLEVGQETCRGVIVKVRQMGLVAATLDASIAISAFRPKILCMSGICAGFSERVELGQLVVASPAWEYQAGKWSDNGFEIAPHQIQMRPATRVCIEQAFADDNIISDLENGLKQIVDRPRKQTRPIIAPATTGSAVIADQNRLKHIENQHRKVAAVDMETFGVYFAAHESDSLIDHFFSVKCVVDYADKNKEDDLHKYGCAVAARACVSLLSKLLGGQPRK